MDGKSAFTGLLMDWHRTSNRREMPWKGERDPYRIWLSEVILQQTRVEQGRSYYERFVEAFATVRDLAEAPDELVFKHWEGLGYYSRCRNLLATARHISGALGGVFPSTHEGILSLKGVGPYTAAAIASFAYGLPHAVVDGNVIRVLARCFGIRDPVGEPTVRKRLSQLADRLLDRTHPAAYNQAIMDFGATVCRPISPKCGECPLLEICEARSAGLQGEIPVKAVRPERRIRWFHYIHAVHQGHTLVRERHARDIWRNLHELILLEGDGPMTPEALVAHPAIGGLMPMGAPMVSEEFRQLLTHQEIRGRFIRIELDQRRSAPAGYHWAGPEELARTAFPKFILTYFAKIGNFT
jgi:A/G-specific adenine glycosylase